jgi:hypothetical protein
MYTLPILNSTDLTMARLFILIAVSALLSMICFSVQAQMSDQPDLLFISIHCCPIKE